MYHQNQNFQVKVLAQLESWNVLGGQVQGGGGGTEVTGAPTHMNERDWAYCLVSHRRCSFWTDLGRTPMFLAVRGLANV